MELINLINELNNLQKDYLRKKGFTNRAFFNVDGSLTDSEKVTYKVKNKYINIDFGTSGAFMINKGDGDIFRIKAYGVIHKGKLCGNLSNINPIDLFNKRWW